MASLATHIDIAGVAAKRRWTLIREAALLNWRVSTTGGTALGGGLDELLHLPTEEAHNIALAYTACEPYLQTALRARLEHLSTYATHRQKQLFLKLIPRVGERLPSAFEPVLTEHPELRPSIESAKLYVLREPGEVLGHIDGLTHSGSQLSAGGHVLSTFETLADEALSKWPKDDLKRFNDAVAKLDPDEERKEVIEKYGDLGFDLSGQRWAKFLLLAQTLWRIAERRNGVRCFRIPRSLFNSNAWKNTIKSATYGTSPVGGKSLFPSAWNQSDILEAIIAVLEHPEALVLRRVSSGREPQFYLRARIKDVDVEVGIAGSRVITAFPSWRQERSDTIGGAYVEWYMEWARLKDQLSYHAGNEPLLTKIAFPNGCVEAYLGRCPTGISATEWEQLALWLNPGRVADAPDRSEASTLQLLIFEWMERSRVVQELEGVSGPVH